jgi:hypothetical protein
MQRHRKHWRDEIALKQKTTAPLGRLILFLIGEINAPRSPVKGITTVTSVEKVEKFPGAGG